MIVGLLAILKAGGAYVPVDPNLPGYRRDQMIEDSGAKLVLTTGGYLEEPAVSQDYLTVAIDGGAWTDFPASPPAHRPSPQDAVYIIYTSGSTGKPKGVVNQHNGPVNRLLWARAYMPLDPAEDVVLQKTTFSFDVSFWEIFWPLTSGATLFLARPGGEKDDRYLRGVIARHKITVVHFVPSMLELFLSIGVSLPGLRRVFTSGEALAAHQVNRLLELYPAVSVHNLYGPTEAGIEVSHWRATGASRPVDRVTIGKALPNVRLYVLDPFDRVCPVGVPGELYIGGSVVAREYNDRPQLTRASFVRKTVVRGWGKERLYRTGDLCRWLPTGEIDFLGRADQQVKIRGYRIELGEIESTLRTYGGMENVQVLAKGEGRNVQLVAFYAATGEFEAEGLRRYLAQRLPEYMVPVRYIHLSALPLGGSGKVDRKALAALDLSTPNRATVPPESEFEVMLHEIWEAVLDVSNLSVAANFHDLGGHSLTAIRLVNRINEAFELELPPTVIFRHPTIRGLAEHLESVIRKLMEELNAADE